MLGQRQAYESLWVRVDLADVQTPSGARFEHHLVRLPRIAIALIVNNQEEALMLWRHRFAVDLWGYELLGGLVEDSEKPVAAAAREAIEESGWRPIGNPQPLLAFEPLPGQASAPIEVFCWREAEQVGKPTPTKWEELSGCHCAESLSSLNKEDCSALEPWSLCCSISPDARPEPCTANSARSPPAPVIARERYSRYLFD